MICSFTLYLKPLNLGEKILKYKNYTCLYQILRENFRIEELKKIVISNFLTKDNYFSNKNYSLKISALDEKIIIKLFQFFFLKKIGEERIKIGKTDFIILNIYNNNKYAKQLDIEELGKLQNEKNLKIKIITPMFFKLGNRFENTTDINLILKNIEKKLKNSSMKDFSDFLIPQEEKAKIKLLMDNTKNCHIDTENEGRIGEIVYDISSLSEKEKLKLEVLFRFAFFSGIGYLSERGYGQIEYID